MGMVTARQPGLPRLSDGTVARRRRPGHPPDEPADRPAGPALPADRSTRPPTSRVRHPAGHGQARRPTPARPRRRRPPGRSGMTQRHQHQRQNQQSTRPALRPENRVRPTRRPQRRRPGRAPPRQPARLGPPAAAARVHRHRDGAVGLRRAGWCSCRASTPTSYAAMAAAEGMVQVDAARRARRHPGPQRRAARRLGRRRDGGRGPVPDPAARAGAREVPRHPARRRLLRHPRRSCAQKDSRFEYIARRVPATQGHRRGRRRRARPASTGSPPGRDPVRDYPAGDVAANLIGFMGTDEPLAGFERTFDGQLAGTDGSARYEVGGGNRIPLGDSTIEPAGQRQGPAHHDRPRPAVVHAAGAAPDRRGLRRRVGLRGRHGHPDRRGPRRSPTTRRSTPTTRWSRPQEDLGSRAR